MQSYEIIHKKGLVGQTEGKAIVIEKLEEVSKLDMNKDIRLGQLRLLPDAYS